MCSLVYLRIVKYFFLMRTATSRVLFALVIFVIYLSRHLDTYSVSTLRGYPHVGSTATVKV